MNSANDPSQIAHRECRVTAAKSARSARISHDDSLRLFVRESQLSALLFRPGQGEILEVSDSLVELFRASRDDLLGRLVLDFIVDGAGATARLALLDAGELDGYHVLERGYRRPDGSEFTVDTSVNSFERLTSVRYAVGVLSSDERNSLKAATVAESTGIVVLGTVDTDWRIDRISDAVEQLLGYPPREVVGESIATFVEPADLPALLVGAGRGLQSSTGATIRVRLRTAGMSRDFRMLVTRLASAPAGGQGFAFAITEDGRAGLLSRTWELESVLQHIAREIEATGVLAGTLGMPAMKRMPALAGLSARELEIVTRLLVGDRVPMIAQQLFLSDSTVRNHLTAVFRKLGVRSQQELLTKLRTGGGH